MVAALTMIEELTQLGEELSRCQKQSCQTIVRVCLHMKKAMQTHLVMAHMRVSHSDDGL